MKGILAVQVLPNSCFAALDFFTANRIIEPKVSATSSYCKYINNIFDILNSSYSEDRVPLRKSLYPLSSSWKRFKELKAWLIKLSRINTKDQDSFKAGSSQ